RVQWAVNSDGSTPTAPGTVVTVPSALQVKNTYVIYSSVSYLYKPTGGIGYVMDKAGVNLSDFSFTRPRQSQCVYYDAATPLPTPPPPCPTN
ncbi:MAG: TadE/TadG family type IV pilus assembly protein, partial [Gemmataceae bacterium]